MSDKKQLAAMGAEMAEQQQQPMCMAKRIEELEAQVRVMAELLQKARPYMDHRGGAGVKGYTQLAKEIDSALAGNLPIQVTPEGWQLVPVVPTEEMCEAGANAPLKVRQSEKCWIGDIYASMLAAAPKPHPKP